MQRRHAQVYFLGQVIDAQRLLVIAIEPFDRLADAMALAVGNGNLIQAMPLRAAQQAVENLAANQRRKHADILG
ncbi:hypothetical protein UB23_05275 [Pseudomonas sp. ES3-33]|nr:hypothetical protein UB23_05275 [Pseudomonas sp. ES3-33]